MPASWSGELPVVAVDPVAGTFTVEADGPDLLIMESRYKAVGYSCTVTVDPDVVAEHGMPVQVGDVMRCFCRAEQ